MHLAIGAEKRRAECLRRVDQIEVAMTVLERVVAIGHRAHVPIEGVPADVEEALETRRPAIGFQLTFSGAWHFPTATGEVEVGAQRIEIAVSRQRRAE